MRRVVTFVITLTIISLACGLFTPASNPGVQPVTPIATVPEPQPFTPVPTFTLQVPTVSVQPPPAMAPEAGYLLEEERQIDGYAIRVWRNPNSEIGFDNILLIERAGQPSIRVNMASAIHDVTGSDVNGDDYPEVVVETFSGGAHCCFGTQVYSLREAAVLILQKPESNAGGYFEDLNGDYILEFVTYEDAFAYQYCPYAAGVGVKSMLTYDFEKDTYIPASPRFPEQYTEDIATHEQRATAAPGEMGEWDGTNICAILPLALDYLYTGQPAKAQTEFASRYSGLDTDAKWEKILQIVQGSPLYTP